jgi:translocation protein SEC72
MALQSDIYTQLSLSMDPTTKAISAPASSSPELTNFLTELNTMHRTLKNCATGVPPPPVPVPPQRSAAVEKMRTAGNQAFRHQRYDEAVNMYSHAITMALTRPVWEPAPLLKEELQVLYLNRAQAHMSCNNYPEALADASLSVDFKRPQNPKAHWRKAKCLKEMGRLEEAKEALEFGLEFGDDGELRSLLKEVEKSLPLK